MGVRLGPEPLLYAHGDAHPEHAAAHGANGVRDEEHEGHVLGHQGSEGQEPYAIRGNGSEDVIRHVAPVTGPGHE